MRTLASKQGHFRAATLERQPSAALYLASVAGLARPRVEVRHENVPPTDQDESCRLPTSRFFLTSGSQTERRAAESHYTPRLASEAGTVSAPRSLPTPDAHSRSQQPRQSSRGESQSATEYTRQPEAQNTRISSRQQPASTSPPEPKASSDPFLSMYGISSTPNATPTKPTLPAPMTEASMNSINTANGKNVKTRSQDSLDKSPILKSSHEKTALVKVQSQPAPAELARLPVLQDQQTSFQLTGMIPVRSPLNSTTTLQQSTVSSDASNKSSTNVGEDTSEQLTRASGSRDVDATPKRSTPAPLPRPPVTDKSPDRINAGASMAEELPISQVVDVETSDRVSLSMSPLVNKERLATPVSEPDLKDLDSLRVSAAASKREARLTSMVETLKARMEEIRAENHELEALLQEAESERESASANCARWEADARAAHAELRAASAQLSSAELRVAEAESQAEDAIAARQSLQEQVGLLQVCLHAAFLM